MESTLKKGALGYKSKDVEAYLVELSNKYSSDVKEKDSEIKKLNMIITELKNKIDDYEKERLSVADALVKAQKEAQEIMDSAVSEAEAKRAEIQKDCDTITQKIADAKDTLASIKKDALNVIKEYEEVVEKFTDFSGIAHDD